jgi:hypothetical protein
MNSERVAEEISFIKQVIQENRKVSYPNGIYFIIWGIIVFFGMIGNFLLVKAGEADKIIWLWLGIAAIGWVVTLIAGHREDRRSGYTTWAGRIYGYIWLSAGICMTIIGFSGPFVRIISPMAICPLIGLVMGMAHFISGLLNDFKWQLAIGVLWWLASIALLFWVALENFLVFGAMMLFFHALPGFILNSYYRKK